MTPEQRIAELEAKLARQKQVIRWQQEALEHKNRALDAMHWVWCDGGCEGGVHRYRDEDGVLRHPDLTEEIVALAERNAQRLRAWFGTYQHRKARFAARLLASGGMTPAEYRQQCPSPYDAVNGETP